MSQMKRTIEKLLDHYVEALRDGCVPTFLKSLTRDEAKAITTSEDFWDATGIARILNGVAFADKARTSNVDLFISRVDAKIASRMKKVKALRVPKRKKDVRLGSLSRTKRGTGGFGSPQNPSPKQRKKTEKTI